MTTTPAKLTHPKINNLKLFKNPNGKSPYWYAGFHHSGKFHQHTLKTRIWEEAVQAASRWYGDTEYELRHGTYAPPSSRSATKFKDLINPTLEGMAVQQKSPHYIKSIRVYLGRDYYICRFFGGMAATDITTRSWDDFRVWLASIRVEEHKKPLSERSVHQLKNAVRLVLIQAYVGRNIESIPRFEDKRKPKKRGCNDRVCFNRDEYARLLIYARQNIRWHEKTKTRWIEDAYELYNYIVFMVNTGLRVSESQALRFKDVSIVTKPVMVKGVEKQREVCAIKITAGKLGAHPACVSFTSAPAVFRRIVARRAIQDPASSTELVFRRHHREAFKRLLRQHDLYFDGYGRKRDFVSLRHTYICFRLEAGVPLALLAKNVRTSIAMIDGHYSKGLDAVSLAVNSTY